MLNIEIIFFVYLKNTLENHTFAKKSCISPISFFYSNTKWNTGFFSNLDNIQAIHF